MYNKSSGVYNIPPSNTTLYTSNPTPAVQYMNLASSTGYAMPIHPNTINLSPQNTAFSMGIGVNPNEPSLALTVFDHGHAATRRDILSQLISQYSPLKETDIAKVFGMMAATHVTITPPGTALQTYTSPYSPLSPNTTLATSWHIFEFIDLVVERCPYLNWVNIIQSLDYPEFYISDYKGTEMIIKGFYYATKLQQDFPIALIMKPWTNLHGQLSFIRSALLAPLELLSFAKSGRKIITPEDAESYLNGPTKNALFHLLNQHWNSLDLIELLCSVTESEYYNDVRPIFEMASKQSSELLCLGLAYFDPPWNSTLHTCLIKLITGFLTGQPSSPVVLPRLWRIHPQLMLLCMTELHRLDPTCISRLLDIAQELKILPKVLEAKPFSFTIDMAALASRREHLNLEKWLTDSMIKHRDAFIRAVLEFLVEKCFHQSSPQRIIIPLSPDVLAIFLRALNSQQGIMTIEQAQLYRDIQAGLHATPETKAIPIIHPQTGQVAATADKNLSINMEEYNNPLFVEFFSQTFPKDIEEEANACYERIYSHEVSVHDIIETMSRFKNSYHQRDILVFHCMLHNLLDEYRFFPKYPEKELNLTGVIFGLLIHNHLVTDTALGISLRFILDALRKPLDSKMFKFGLTALLQFQSRLYEWPPYCQQLLEIPGLAQLSSGVIADLYAFIQSSYAHSVHSRDLHNRQLHPILYFLDKTGAAIGGGHSSPHASMMPVSFIPASVKGFVCLQRENHIFEKERDRIYMLGKEEDPDETLQERFSLLLNNVSTANFASKSKELETLVQQHGPSIYRWLSSTLVSKRISTEPNYHSLYLDLLPKQTNPSMTTLQSFILYEMYGRVRALIEAEKTSSNSGDRTILKNLGSFLGQFTLGRDRPILTTHLPLKELLLEGYHLDKLLVVIPFVCKVLESCKTSRIFAVPWNPWLMAQLCLLAEMYAVLDLKLNLKFEIEVLCKHLSVDMKELFLAPHGILKSAAALRYRRMTEVHEQPTVPLLKEEPVQLVEDSVIFPGLIHLVDHILSTSAKNMLYEKVSPSFVRRELLYVFELTLRQVYPMVCQQALLVAVQTTLSLVFKDFPYSDKSSKDIPKLIIDKMPKEVPKRFQDASSQIVLEKHRKSAAESMLQFLVTQLILGTSHQVLGRTLLEILFYFESKTDTTGILSGESLQMLSNTENIDSTENGPSSWMKLVSDAAVDPLSMVLEQITFKKALEAYTKLQLIRDEESSYNEPAASFVLPSLLREPGAGRVYEDLSARHSRILQYQANPWISAALVRDIPRVTALDLQHYKNVLLQQDCAVPSSILPVNLSAPLTNGASLPSVLGSSIGTTQIQKDLTGAPFNGEATNLLESYVHGVQEQVMGLLLMIDRMISQHSGQSFSSFPSDHELRHLMKQVLILAMNQSAYSRDETCLLFTTKIIHILFKTESVLGIEVHVVLLDKLCELSSRVTRQVVQWMLQLKDKRKWNVPITVAFFLSGLVNVMDYDLAIYETLLELIGDSQINPSHRNEVTTEIASEETVQVFDSVHDDNFTKEFIDFIMALIKRCVLIDPVVTSSYTFSKTLSVLSTLYSLKSNTSSGTIPAHSSFLLSMNANHKQTVCQFLEAIENRKDGFNETLIREQVHYYFHEWQKLCSFSMMTEKNFLVFVHQIYRQGYFSNRELLEKFMRQLINLVFSNVDMDDKEWERFAKLCVYFLRVYTIEDKQALLTLFLSLFGQSLIQSIKLLENSSDSSQIAENSLGISEGFVPTQLMAAWTRFIIYFLSELCIHEKYLQNISLKNEDSYICNCEMVVLFGQWLHSLRPTLLPCFAFGWFECISHRSLLPKLVLKGNKEHANVHDAKMSNNGMSVNDGSIEDSAAFQEPAKNASNIYWTVAHQLLLDVLHFMKPFLLGYSRTMTPSLRLYYKALLRLFLLLLHDFPEFLAAYHLSLVNPIPLHCIQLRNLILSAFPRHLKLLDPFTPNLKMASLEDSLISPECVLTQQDMNVLMDSVGELKINEHKEALHGNFGSISDFTIIQKLGKVVSSLSVSSPFILPSDLPESDRHLFSHIVSPQYYFSENLENIKLPRQDELKKCLESLRNTTSQPLMHVSISKANMILYLFLSSFTVDQVPNAVRFINTLLQEKVNNYGAHANMTVESNLSFVVFQALANQLRYPNKDTLFYSTLILTFFANPVTLEAHREQCTRVLLERLIVNRPHPWGLLVTFIELIRSSTYNFWNHPFTHFSPDIERLFDSVAKSCMLPKPK